MINTAKEQQQVRLVKFQDHTVTVRESDGFWNATEMAKIFGKLVADFIRLKGTQAFLEALADSRNEDSHNADKSRDMGNPITDSDSHNVDKSSVTQIRVTVQDLVQINQGGLGDQATWVDPEVGLKLAAWLNPKFEVWVFKMIRTLLTEGEVKLKDHIKELESLTDDLSNELALKENTINRIRYALDPDVTTHEDYLDDCDFN